MKKLRVLVILICVICGLTTSLAINLLSKDSNICDVSGCINNQKQEEVSLELIGEESIRINYSSEFLDPGVSAEYMGLDVSEYVKVRTNLDIYNEGIYYYEYYIMMFDAEYMVSREVEVLMDYGITFELVGSKHIILDYGSIYQEEGVIATDNRTGEDIEELVRIKGEVDTRLAGTQYIYYHFNYNGQRHIISRKILVKDYDNYEFRLVNDELEEIDVKFTHSYDIKAEVVAYDNLDNKDISGFIEIETNFVKGKVGLYTIKYTLSYNGIIASITKTLVVK